MFELSASTTTPDLLIQINPITAKSFKVLLTKENSQQIQFEMQVTLNKSHLWDQFQKTHSNLLRTETEFEEFKEKKNFEAQLASKESKSIISNLESKLENFQMKLERLQSLNKSLLNEKTCVEEMLAHERDYIQNLQIKIKENFESQSEALKKAEDRDSEFISRLTELMKENLELKQDIQQLRFSLEEMKTQPQKNETKCFKCLEIDQEVACSRDFYNTINLSQENLEVLFKNMTRVNEDTLSQINFLNFKVHEENEKLKLDLKVLNEVNENLSSQLAQTTQENERLEQELLSKEKTKFEEPENFHIKTTQELTENTETSCINLTTLNISSIIPEDSSKSIERNQELNQKIQELEDLNSKLQIELCQFKSKTIQELKTERLKVEPLDLLLEKFCFENCHQNLFIKILSGTYLYGSKQVNIFLEKDQIFCRCGGFTSSITNFLKSESSKCNVLTSLNTSQERPIFSPRLKSRKISRENEAPSSDENRKLKEKFSVLPRGQNKKIY